MKNVASGCHSALLRKTEILVLVTQEIRLNAMGKMTCQNIQRCDGGCKCCDKVHMCWRGRRGRIGPPCLTDLLLIIDILSLAIDCSLYYTTFVPLSTLSLRQMLRYPEAHPSAKSHCSFPWEAKVDISDYIVKAREGLVLTQFASCK